MSALFPCMPSWSQIMTSWLRRRAKPAWGIAMVVGNAVRAWPRLFKALPQVFDSMLRAARCMLLSRQLQLPSAF